MRFVLQLFFKGVVDFTFMQWFDKQRAYLDGLESQLRGLVKSIEVVAKQRAGTFCLFILAQ